MKTPHYIARVMFHRALRRDTAQGAGSFGPYTLWGILVLGYSAGPCAGARRVPWTLRPCTLHSILAH